MAAPGLSSEEGHVRASLYFLARSPKYEKVKPYTVRFDTDGIFPYTNIDNVKHEVTITNLRQARGDFSLARNGFQVITIPDHMSYGEFNDDELIRSKHIPLVLTTLQERLGAVHIHVLDYRVRKRDATFPVRSDKEYAYLQPSSRIHLDYTAEAVRKTVQGYYGKEAGLILNRPWQVINVWHPIRGPCVDWPLALCDVSTVDFVNDTMSSDFVDSWGHSENVQVHFNPSHKWFYLRNQMPHELLVFKSADSADGMDNAFPGTPHGAFQNPLATDADLPRQSLELRLLATY